MSETEPSFTSLRNIDGKLKKRSRSGSKAKFDATTLENALAATNAERETLSVCDVGCQTDPVIVTLETEIDDFMKLTDSFTELTEDWIEELGVKKPTIEDEGYASTGDSPITTENDSISSLDDKIEEIDMPCFDIKKFNIFVIGNEELSLNNFQTLIDDRTLNVDDEVVEVTVTSSLLTSSKTIGDIIKEIELKLENDLKFQFDSLFRETTDLKAEQRYHCCLYMIDPLDPNMNYEQISANLNSLSQVTNAVPLFYIKDNTIEWKPIVSNVYDKLCDDNVKIHNFENVDPEARVVFTDDSGNLQIADYLETSNKNCSITSLIGKESLLGINSDFYDRFCTANRFQFALQFEPKAREEFIEEFEFHRQSALYCLKVVALDSSIREELEQAEMEHDRVLTDSYATMEGENASKEEDNSTLRSFAAFKTIRKESSQQSTTSQTSVGSSATSQTDKDTVKELMKAKYATIGHSTTYAPPDDVL